MTTSLSILMCMSLSSPHAILKERSSRLQSVVDIEKGEKQTAGSGPNRPFLPSISAGNPEPHLVALVAIGGAVTKDKVRYLGTN